MPGETPATLCDEQIAVLRAAQPNSAVGRAMDFHPCGIQGAWLVDPAPRVDSRGRFMRAWCQREFSEHGIDFTPVQANMSLSLLKGHDPRSALSDGAGARGQTRSLHAGTIFDVVVDLRPSSATYRAWHGELSKRRQRSDVLRAGRLRTWLPGARRHKRDSLSDFCLLFTK